MTAPLNPHQPTNNNHSAAAAMVDVPVSDGSQEILTTAVGARVLASTQPASMADSASSSSSAAASSMSEEAESSPFEKVYTAIVLNGALPPRQAAGRPVSASMRAFNRSPSLGQTKAVAARVLIDKESRLLKKNVDLALTSLAGLDNTNPFALASRGKVNRLKGNLDAALADLNRSLTLKGDHIPALLERYSVHRSKGDRISALKDLDDCLKIQDDNVSALQLRAGLHRLNRDYTSAIADMDRAIKVEGKNASLLRFRGDIHCDQGNCKAALEDLNESLELDGKNAQAFEVRANIHLKQGTLHAALVDIDESLRLDSRNAAWKLGSRGEIHRKLGNFKAALADLDQSLTMNGQNAWALRARGNIYYQQGNFAAAFEDSNKSLTLFSHNPQALATRGAVYFQQKNFKAALEDLDKSLTIDGNNSFALEMRGAVHLGQGALQAALADLNKSLSLNGKNPFALSRRGEIYRIQKKYIAALADLETSLAYVGDNAFALSRMGDILRKIDNFKGALECLDKSLALEGKDIFAWIARGKVYSWQVNLPWALFDLNKALELDANSVSALKERGRVYIKKGDFALALVDFFKLPMNPDLQILINQALRSIGDKTSLPSESNRLAPLFRDLMGLRGPLADAATPSHFSLSPADKGTFVGFQHIATVAKTQYEHVYKLLIALQQLDENRAPLLQLFSEKAYSENIGDQFAFTLSGILLHSEDNKKVIDPVGKFIDTVMATHAKAKAQGKLLDFFANAFSKNSVCLGAKSKTLTEYAANFEMDLAEIPDLGHATAEKEVSAFFVAFRAVQRRKMALEKSLNRAELTASLTAPAGPHHAVFYAEYCTVEKFTAYLTSYPASPAVIAAIPFLIGLDSFQA